MDGKTNCSLIFDNEQYVAEGTCKNVGATKDIILGCNVTWNGAKKYVVKLKTITSESANYRVDYFVTMFSVPIVGGYHNGPTISYQNNSIYSTSAQDQDYVAHTINNDIQIRNPGSSDFMGEYYYTIEEIKGE